MKNFFLSGLFCLSSVYGDPSLEKYFLYLQQFSKPLGNYQEGEIEVVLDPIEISKISAIQADRLIEKGISKQKALEFSRIGVLQEGSHWIWLRDAVYYPNKVPGTRDRLVWRSELEGKCPGVAVLPILPSGQIALIATYRHATRSWEIEIPRGGTEAKEIPEDSAKRELKEETGFQASSLVFLGEIATGSGMQSCILPVFAAIVSLQEDSLPEFSEAIDSVIVLTKEELKEALIQGSLKTCIGGIMQQVPLRDPFLTFALLQAEIRKLI